MLPLLVKVFLGAALMSYALGRLKPSHPVVGPIVELFVVMFRLWAILLLMGIIVNL